MEERVEYDTRTFPERVDAELIALRIEIERMRDLLDYQQRRIERLEENQDVRQDK